MDFVRWFTYAFAWWLCVSPKKSYFDACATRYQHTRVASLEILARCLSDTRGVVSVLVLDGAYRRTSYRGRNLLQQLGFCERGLRNLILQLVVDLSSYSFNLLFYAIFSKHYT